MVTIKKLKGLMAENSLTQPDIAEIIETSSTTVNRKITGKSDFTLTEAEKIANHFGMTIDEIFIINEKKKVS